MNGDKSPAGSPRLATPATRREGVKADDQYRGPEADARAARIEAALGTDAETLFDTVWLLRYRTVKHDIQWPTHEELLEMRRDD